MIKSLRIYIFYVQWKFIKQFLTFRIYKCIYTYYRTHVSSLCIPPACILNNIYFHHILTGHDSHFCLLEGLSTFFEGQPHFGGLLLYVLLQKRQKWMYGCFDFEVTKHMLGYCILIKNLLMPHLLHV